VHTSRKSAKTQIIANQVNASFVHVQLVEAGLAKELSVSALADARESALPAFEVAAQGNLGNAERSLGEFDVAIERMEAELVIRRPIQDAHDFVDDLADLTLAYVRAGRRDEALTTARELKRISESSLDGAFWPHYIWWPIARGFETGGEHAQATAAMADPEQNSRVLPLASRIRRREPLSVSTDCNEFCRAMSSSEEVRIAEPAARGPVRISGVVGNRSLRARSSTRASRQLQGFRTASRWRRRRRAARHRVATPGYGAPEIRDAALPRAAALDSQSYRGTRSGRREILRWQLSAKRHRSPLQFRDHQGIRRIQGAQGRYQAPHGTRVWPAECPLPFASWARSCSENPLRS
jgi:tetratricopeptide (TPR) repeat protein